MSSDPEIYVVNIIANMDCYTNRVAYKARLLGNCRISLKRGVYSEKEIGSRLSDIIKSKMLDELKKSDNINYFTEFSEFIYYRENDIISIEAI